MSRLSDVSNDNLNKNYFRQFLPVFFITFIFFLNFTIRIIISPLLPTIEIDMNLTHDQAGSFFLFMSSGYFLSLLFSGFVSSQLSHKKTIILSIVATGIAAVSIGFVDSLWDIRFGLFMVGIAAGLYLPSGLAILTASINSKNWGKALAIHELAPNLSFLLAPVLCEFFLLWLSWRSVFIFIGLFCVLLGISFFKFPDDKDFPGEAPMLSSFLPLMATPSFWMMISLFSLGVMGSLGIYSMLPLYLVNEHGMLQSHANTLVTISRVLTIPASLFIGWATDRFGLKPTLVSILFFTGITTLFIGVFSGKFLQIMIFFQPIAAVCFFPPAFAALSQIGSEKTRNIAISFTIPLGFLLGGGVAPNMIGILGKTGHFSSGFIISGTLILLGAVLPFFLKFSNKT